jgi:diguanylate cyclase (GGDEF)-like protein
MNDDVRARIAALEAQLGDLRRAQLSGALSTVKVPKQFEGPFLRAQEYVARYFADRVEEPATATISIAGERYVLLRAASLSVEFVELVMRLYQDKGPEQAQSVASNLLFDLAHAIGHADATSFQKKMGVNEPIDNLSAGPIHFAFSGWAFVDISADSHPSPDQDYFLLYDHPFSFESHSWLAKGKRSNRPVCVMNAGYSSGWCEASFGLPLVAVEIECLAAGGKHCRFIMAPPSQIEGHLARYKREHAADTTEGEVSVIPEFFQRKRLEDDLRAANELLERRVRARTEELELVTEQLRHQALHDALTGLPNRALLYDRIQQSILAMRRDGRPFALLFLDLDGFKEINDTFGHHAGDLLLGKVGARLRTILRGDDTIARLGGDEFAILLGAVDQPTHAAAVGAQLIAALEQPFVIDDRKVVTGASIGVAYCPEHGSDPTTLMRHADIAMYAAKANRGGLMIYDPRRDEHSPGRLQLVGELRDSLDDRHLELHFQPQVESVGGRLVRFEALLRWNRPDGVQLLPGQFLPLIETSDLIDRIFRWVLDAAIRECCAWRRAGFDFGVSINLATHNLHDLHLPEHVALALTAHGLPPRELTIEITESGIMGDATHAASVCRRLREIGVGLSIDDFGTGYSSLVHLKHLPFTEIKIDRSFTHDMLTNEHDAAIVRSIIDLGHQLDRVIVAEGVESQAVLDRLREHGCDLAQGYFISRPLARDALYEWLRGRPAAEPAAR